MFALKIPLTGFFVGGFAVLIISLIAWYSNRDFKKVMQATLLVLIVKATVSPHAPPPAYVAVAFQGFMGAFLFSFLPNFKVVSVLFGVIAMAESALQKLIITTLIYGESLWEALDKLFEKITKDFSLPANMSFSLLVIGAYLFLYIIWGFVLGIFAGKLPILIHDSSDDVVQFYRLRDIKEIDPKIITKKKSKIGRWLQYILVLLFIVAVFTFSGMGNNKEISYIILRSVAAILLLFFVLRPIVKWLINKWLQKQSSGTKKSATEILELLPVMRNYITPAWQFAGKQKNNRPRIRNFIVNLLVLSLHEQQ